MGRSYVADLKIQQILDNPKFFNSGFFTNVGLIVGQITDNKDYVVQLMKTPLLDEVTESPIVEPQVSDGDKKDAIKNSILEKTVEKCVSIHARQVRQMLTGGMDVLGIFVHTTMDDMKASMLRYKQLLYSVFEVVNKFDRHLSLSGRSNDRLLLHICSQSKKLTARSFDISDSKNTGQMADWKYQKILDSFTSLATRFSLRTSIYVGECCGSAVTLEEQITNGLVAKVQLIHDSLASISGLVIETKDVDDDGDADELKKKGDISGKPIEMFNNNEGSVIFSEDNSGDQRMKTADCDGDNEEEEDDEDDDDYSYEDYKKNMNVVVDFLQNMSTKIDQPLESPNVQRCGAKILIHGTLIGKAFVHCKTSVKEAMKALKRDLIRSLLTRCELVCQDLLQTEEDQSEFRVVYETPMRAFAPLKSSSIFFSDYYFQEETKQDSLERFRDVMGLCDLKSKNVDHAVEVLPDSKDLEIAEHMQLGENNKYYEDIFSERSRNCTDYAGSIGCRPNKKRRNNTLCSVEGGLTDRAINFLLQPFFHIPVGVLLAIVALLVALFWGVNTSYFLPSVNRNRGHS